VAWNDRNHRAKNLFLRDSHLRIDVGKYGWLHEPAILILALVEPIATAHQLRAFVLANFHITKVGLQLLFIYGWSHLDRFIESIANFQFLGARHVALHELAIHALLDDDAAGRRAALASSAEASPKPALDGEFEIRVIQHNHRILPAELQRAMFKALGRDATHDAAHGRGSGQRNSADISVLGQWCAYVGAISGDDVDHAFRNAGISESANQVECGERRVLCRLDDAGIAANHGGQ